MKLRQAFERAIAIEPELADAHSKLGQHAKGVRHTDEAEAKL